MESDTVLMKIFVKQTMKRIIVRRKDLRRHYDRIQPGIEVLLDCLAKQLAAWRKLDVPFVAITNLFMLVTILPTYMHK